MKKQITLTTSSTIHTLLYLPPPPQQYLVLLHQLILTNLALIPHWLKFFFSIILTTAGIFYIVWDKIMINLTMHTWFLCHIWYQTFAFQASFGNYYFLNKWRILIFLICHGLIAGIDGLGSTGSTHSAVYHLLGQYKPHRRKKWYFVRT